MIFYSRSFVCNVKITKPNLINCEKEMSWCINETLTSRWIITCRTIFRSCTMCSASSFFYSGQWNNRLFSCLTFALVSSASRFFLSIIFLQFILYRDRVTMLMRSWRIEKWCARSLRAFRASDGYNLWPDIDFALSPVRKTIRKNGRMKVDFEFASSLFGNTLIVSHLRISYVHFHLVNVHFFNEFRQCRHSRIYKGEWQRKAIIMMTFAANVSNVRHSPFSSAPSIPNCNILLT